MEQRRNYRVDNQDTAIVKEYAMHNLRADLVGVANIERFAEAPLKMSPHGLMPDAKSVIVMAVHHPDTAIERGGITHPQDIGPYTIQYHMNWRLDDMSYRMACYIQKLGYKAVGIASSNIWRYCGFEDLKAQFAPDTSHMHAAVAAGLAEFGYNGLAITPEYGARVRYVTVITDMELTPSPLLEPGSVCDKCMLCRKECRSGALSKELDGYNVVKIEGKEYRYAKKNLWRCAWGEHFDLDLDLNIPEKVTEEVIMEAVNKYPRRGGEFGSCLRYCVPKALRYFDREFTNAPRRRDQFIPNPEVTEFHRGLFESLRGIAADWGVDYVLVTDGATIQNELGVDLNTLLPGAVTAVTMVASRRMGGVLGKNEAIHTHNFAYLFSPVAIQAGYDMVRVLENHGYIACQDVKFPDDLLEKKIVPPGAGEAVSCVTFLTSAELPNTGWQLNKTKLKLSGRALKERLKREASVAECDMLGVSSAYRIDRAVPDLMKYYEGEEEFIVRNKAANIYRPYDPEVKIVKRHVNRPEEYLPGAKSVIVIGLPLPEKSVDITGRTPAKAVGPYVFSQYEVIWRLQIVAWRLAGILERAGYQVALSRDLTCTGSVSMNPRGEMPDYFCNNVAAAAAGLGVICASGAVVTPEYGCNARYLAIITDAEVPEDAVLLPEAMQKECGSCDKNCMSKCPTGAFTPIEVKFELDGVAQCYRKIDHNRCNWAKRYSLVGSEGGFYTGWDLDLDCPSEITPAKLADALRQLPQIEKIRPCTFEQCVMGCAHCREQK